MKNYIIVFLFSLIPLFTVAQMGQKREQIKALKTAYITTELSLTSEEAEKFWPIYNAFEDRQQELRQKKLKNYLDRMENEAGNITEKEAAVLVSQIETVEEELFQLRKKLLSQLKGVISNVKILKLKRAEENFNKRLLKQLAERRRKN